jgi:HK97 gp10 family phage protein
MPPETRDRVSVPRFVSNPAGIKELAGQAAMRAYMEACAEAAADDVRRRAEPRRRIVRSIKTTTNKEGGVWRGIVYTDWWVALFHELGTRKMSARPFLRPGVESVLARVKGSFRATGRR